MIWVEWLKLRKYKPFWILLGLYPLSLASILLIIWGIYDKIAAKIPAEQILKGSPFAFPQIWQTVTYTASFFHFFPSVIVLLSICNEFEFRTHRQAILNGWSRFQLFGSKVALALFTSGATTLFVGITALGLGLVHGTTSSPLAGAEYLGKFWVQSLSYSMLSVFIGFWLRHGLSSLAFFLIYSNFLEKIGLAVVNRFFSGVSDYGPLAVANSLILFPVEVPKQLMHALPSLEVLLAANFGYCALFIGAAWLSFQRRDL
jgi:ABC-2 type transport system permease protein